MIKRSVPKNKKDRSGLLKKCADFLDVDMLKLAKKSVRKSAKDTKKK